MSTKTIAERIQELASTTSQTELLALINRYSKDIEHENAFEVVVKAIEMNNLEKAKILAVVNMLTHYCWTVDPAPEFDTAITKAQNGFSWVSYVDFTATSHRKGILRRLSNKNTLAEALISKNLIRLCYFVQCPIHTFSLMLAEFNDPEQLSETTYRIMIVKGLTRSDRHHRMKIMKECNKLTLEPCGPEKLSPPLYCLLLDKLYLLKYFKHLPGLGKYRPNFLIYAWTHNHRYLKHIQLFDKEELKTMLVEKHDKTYVVDLLKKFKGKHLTAAFVSAFRELLTEGKLRDSEEVELPYLIHSNIGGKFIYQHSGIIGSIQRYADAEHFSGENGSHFIGHTAFTFEELPFEIFQLICDHLNSRAIFALISSSKSLQQFSTRFDQRYYEQLMKREFSMIYGSLETDQSETSVDWKHKFDIYSRREYGWHNCQDPVQIRINPPNEDCAFGSILAFDENWMIIGTKYNGTLLWNFKHQKLYHEEFISSKKPSSILNSPESEFPTIVSYLGLSEVAIVNFNEPKSAIRKFKMQGWTTYLASVSPTRFLAGDMPTLYDVELSETIAVKQCNQISRASIAKYNKINQLTAVAFFEAHDGYHHYMCILDQNLEITHKVGPYKCVEEITWLNEFTYSTTEGNGKLKISDIRMPHGYVHKTNTDVVNNYKRISRTEHKHMPNQTGNFTNNLFLEIDAETKLACVWSMKDFTWSNVIVLPDDVKGERVFCNSRYAAVETTDNSICLLDFMSNK